jgi:hypothetical protein
VSTSSGGVAPRIPSSGWKVLWQRAFSTYLATSSATPTDAAAIAGWIEACTLLGPPPSAVQVNPEDDYYLAAIPGTRLTAGYRVVEFEFLILVSDFR